MLACTALSPASAEAERAVPSHLYLIEADSGRCSWGQESDGAVPVLAFDLHVHRVALSLDILRSEGGLSFHIADQIKVHISFFLRCEENINWEPG